jgi:hypothetical protein
MKAIAISAEAWEALRAHAEAWGVNPAEPQRSPYGHVYLWLNPMTRDALEAARGPSEGLSEVMPHGSPRRTHMDELHETVETLIDLDEPETILPTLRRAAERRKGERWQRLARVLAQAEASMDKELEAPADPKPDAEAVHAEQQEHMRRRASLYPDLETKPDVEAKPE